MWSLSLLVMTRERGKEGGGREERATKGRGRPQGEGEWRGSHHALNKHVRYGTLSEFCRSARAWVERGSGPLRPAGRRSSVYSASGRDIPQRAIAGCRSALLSVTAAYGCQFLQRAVAPRAVALKPPPAVPSRLPIPCAVPSAPPQHPSQPNMPIALPKKLYKVRRRNPLCHAGALNRAPRSAPRPRA